MLVPQVEMMINLNESINTHTKITFRLPQREPIPDVSCFPQMRPENRVGGEEVKDWKGEVSIPVELSDDEKVVIDILKDYSPDDMIDF